jgi:hypothetical protein
MNEADKQEIPERMKIQSQVSYKNVRVLNPFDFVEHTYFGTHGYRDCSYLIPHPREVFYESRRDSSYYINVFASVINAMVDEVFVDELVRKSSSGLFDEFIKNADGLGATLQEIVEDAMYLARMNDCAFVVMDNYPKNLQPSTIVDAMNKRIMPYVYIKRIQDIYKLVEDTTGRLVSIDFVDAMMTVAQGRKTIEVQTYRHWDSMRWEHYYTTGKGNVIIDEGEHGLGVLPVIPITDFSRKKKISKIVLPQNYSLAFLCYALFNKESEIVSMEQYQCFSIFYVSGRISTSTIGHANVIEVPLDAKFPPGYTSPNPSMMDGLVKNSDRLIEAVYRNAKQKGVIVVVEQSGIAKQWDFRGEEAVLKRTATAGQKLEMTIANLFMRYTKTNFEFVVVYPKEYSPSYQQDMIASTLDIMREMPPKALANKLWSRLGSQLFPEDEELHEELDREGGADNEPSEPPPA